MNLEEIHHKSIHNKETLKNSKIIGCFYCLKYITFDEIKDWVDEKKDTAICPYCGIDSVVGDSMGTVVDDKLLKNLQIKYF